jgi:glycosyltransferase involved in cell wall biosynthesis
MKCPHDAKMAVIFAFFNRHSTFYLLLFTFGFINQFMVAISVVIITFNEERNLARCLSSLKNIADEIVVVDSYSTDGTIDIASGFGARVLLNSFAGYGRQKNFAAQQAAHNWVLSLDADEVVSPELERSILEMKKGPGHNVYEVPRLTNYCGQWIKHCGWYPDRQTRLFDRTKGRWEEQKVHEYWRPDNDGAPKGILTGDLLHYSFTTINEHLAKIEKYSELGARVAIEKGKNAGLLKIWLYPKWRFFVDYYIRRGFLDGFYGYVICKLAAHAAFIKYTKTRLYRSNEGRDL